MIKFAKVINEETKLCEVGLGTDGDFYRGMGMTEQEVEQAWDGSWYLQGYVPEKPVNITIKELEAEIDAINILQVRDMAIITAAESAEKVQEARQYFEQKQQRKNALIAQINELKTTDEK